MSNEPDQKDSTLDTTSPLLQRFEWSWLKWPETWIYPSLGAVDIALTYVLIGYYGHVEGNPIARYFVDGWGLKGMIWFKLGMVSVILGIVHYIAQTRLQTARRVAQFAVATVTFVVCYSIMLIVNSR